MDAHRLADDPESTGFGMLNKARPWIARDLAKANKNRGGIRPEGADNIEHISNIGHHKSVPGSARTDFDFFEPFSCIIWPLRPYFLPFLAQRLVDDPESHATTEGIK